MKLNLYAVLDEKAKAFAWMHFMQTHGEAIRSFGDAVRNEKSKFSLHPEDYSLYYLGIFNDEDGAVKSVSPIQFLSRGSDFFPVNPISNPVEVSK